MKLKLSESQYKRIFLKEQNQNSEERLEKTLSSFTYLDKPFSCVANEPMKLEGKNVFPINKPKEIIYRRENDKGTWGTMMQLTFKKKEIKEQDNQIYINFAVGAKGKRDEQVLIMGKYQCGKGTNTSFQINRRIEIKLTDIFYYIANPDGSTDKWKDTRTTTPSSVFSGVMSNNKVYNSLKELSVDLNKIKADHTKLKNKE